MKSDEELKALRPYDCDCSHCETENRRALYNAGLSDASRAGWVSVAERLPKKGERVLAYEEFYGCLGVAFMHRADGGWEFEGYPKDDCGVTHWRALPEPPAGG